MFDTIFVSSSGHGEEQICAEIVLLAQHNAWEPRQRTGDKGVGVWGEKQQRREYHHQQHEDLRHVVRQGLLTKTGGRGGRPGRVGSVVAQHHVDSILLDTSGGYN